MLDLLDPVTSIQPTLTLLLWVAALVLQGFALVDAVVRRGNLFVSAGKLSKPLWLAFLGVGLLVQLARIAPLGILSIAGVIAAAVYLADVRPKLQQLGGGRGGSRGGGPYGGW